MKTKFHLFILIALVLFGCAQEPEVPPTQLPTDTLIPPTTTPVPTATNTVVPSDTPQPTFTPTPAPEIIDGPKSPYSLFLPAYPPEEAWEGFPIHPDAIKGQEYLGGYHYSTNLPATELKEFYLSMLGEKGWNLSAIGEAEDGSVILIFQNGADQVSITIFDYGSEIIMAGVTLPPRAVFIEK